MIFFPTERPARHAIRAKQTTARNASVALPIALLLLSATSLVAPIAAQRFGSDLESLSQGEAVRKVYAPIVQQANRSIVEVVVDGEVRVLGTVVAKDLIVTKLSELSRKADNPNNEARLACRKGDATFAATQIAFDRPADLAILRVTDSNLPPVQWQDKVPAIGGFLASPDGSAVPVGVGVLSAPPYQHTRERAFLGIRFASTDGPAKLEEVVAHGAARAAGLLAGDTVVQFGEWQISATQELRERIRSCKPGDTVRVTVERDGKAESFDVKLGTNNSAATSGQENVWGELSEVRSGFQSVLQHDTVLQPKQCGGPVVDLSGKVLGVNIARAGRVETLALPAGEVQALVKRLLATTSKPRASSKSH